MKLRILSFATIIIALATVSIQAMPKLNIMCDETCQKQTSCKLKSPQIKILTEYSCSQLQAYYPDLVSASRKYSTPTLKLTPYVLAGLIDRETLWGKALKPSTCGGYGDLDYGHGIVQIHGAFSEPKLGTFAKPNTKVMKRTDKYGKQYFNWSSCNESIQYLGAYLMNIDDAYSNAIMNKLSKAKMNITKDSNGSLIDFKSQYAYMTLIIDAYNAGGYGVAMREGCYVNGNGIVVDGCTTGKDYGTDILMRAKEYYIVDVGMNAWEGELFRFDW